MAKLAGAISLILKLNAKILENRDYSDMHKHFLQSITVLKQPQTFWKVGRGYYLEAPAHFPENHEDCE